MKIRPVKAEVFHDGDGRTDMTKLLVAFRKFCKRANVFGTVVYTQPEFVEVWPVPLLSEDNDSNAQTSPWVAPHLNVTPCTMLRLRPTLWDDHKYGNDVGLA